MRRPVLADIGGKNPSPIFTAPQAELWTFSFQHFKQIDYFGLDKTEPKWFVSLLDRLKDLSKYSKDEFIRQAKLKDNFRYHLIDWKAKNIPITKSDLNWIPSQFLSNDIEYPFYQFHVAKALGRIVGYWNSNVFNVVLLDPLHNIQPSSYNAYKVKESYPLNCEFTSLLLDVDNLKEGKCSNPECGYMHKIKNFPSNISNSNIVIAHLDEDYFNHYKNITTTGGKSFTDIMQRGITSYIE